MFSSRIRRACTVVVYGLVTVALAYAVRQVWVKAGLYLAGIYGPDATLYWTMGNALRNGLTMYLDIFEPKPPGMFLLSAASFSLFGDGTLGNVLSMVILLCTPVLFVVWSARYARGKHRVPLMFFGLLTGVTIALYNSTIGGDWQTEYYGAFLGLLYIFSIDRYQRSPTVGWVIAACASFALAIVFKETFLPALTAATLLLLRNRGEWFRLWIIPIACAGALMMGILIALGALEAYVTIYLPGIFGNYVVRGAPVWARGVLQWENMYKNVLDFSGLFPVLIGALFVAALPSSEGMRELRWRIAAAFFALGVMMLGRSFTPVELRWNAGVSFALVVVVLGLIALWASAPTKKIPAYVGNILRPLLALYLGLTSIALGPIYHGQYFAIAIPFYAALFLLILRRQRRPPMIMGMTTVACVVLLTSTAFSTTDRSIEEEPMHRAHAAALDAILDACGVDRYYFLEGRSFVPFTAHSPLNYYVYNRIEHIPRYHPLFLEPSIRAIGQARIIMNSRPYKAYPRPGNEEEEAIGKSAEAFLRQKFSIRPWACARGLPVPEGYELLYRKDPRDDSPFPLQSRHGVDFSRRASV